MLLHAPYATCKFLAKWQGPYTVLKRVGPVSYHLQQPGKHADTQLYLINFLKKWIELMAVVSVFAVSHTDQPQDLIELVDQLSDIFSTPG